MKKIVFSIAAILFLIIGGARAIAEEEINLLWNIPFGSKAPAILDHIEEETGQRVRMDFLGNLMVTEDQELRYLDQHLKEAQFFISDSVGLHLISLRFFPLERSKYIGSVDPELALLEDGIAQYLHMAEMLMEMYGEPTQAFIAYTNRLGEMKYYAVPTTGDGSIDRNALVDAFVAEGEDIFVRMDWRNFCLSASTQGINEDQNQKFKIGILVFDYDERLEIHPDFSKRHDYVQGAPVSRFLDLPLDISQQELQVFLSEIAGTSFETFDYSPSDEYELPLINVYMANQVTDQTIAMRKISSLMYFHIADASEDEYGLQSVTIGLQPIYRLSASDHAFRNISEEFTAVCDQVAEEYGVCDAIMLETENKGVVYFDPKKSIDWDFIEGFVEGQPTYKLIARFGHVEVIGSQQIEFANSYMYLTAVMYSRNIMTLPLPEDPMMTDEEGRHLLYGIPFDASVDEITEFFESTGLRFVIRDSGGPFFLLYTENAHEYSYHGSQMKLMFYRFDKQSGRILGAGIVLRSYVWEKEMARAIGEQSATRLLDDLIMHYRQPNQTAVYVGGLGFLPYDMNTIKHADTASLKAVNESDAYAAIAQIDNITLISSMSKAQESDTLHEWTNQILYTSEPMDLEYIVASLFP